MANVPRVTKWTPPPTRLQGEKLLKAKQAEARAKELADAANAVRIKADEDATKADASLGDQVDELKALVNAIIKNMPRMMPGGGGGKRMVAKVLARDFPLLGTGNIFGLPEAEDIAPTDLWELFQGGVHKKLSYEDFLQQLLEDIDGVLPPSGPATYFFDAVGGNDANNGRSALTAFQSIARFNAHNFLPGDVISFRRGQTHNGGMVMPSSGTAAAPIVINAFGTGAAPVIASGAAVGFTSVSKQYFTLDGLEFLGGVVNVDLTRTPNAVDGIRIENAQAGDTKLAGIRILNNTIHEYGLCGINVIGTNGAAGTAGILIDNNEVFACTHNASGGLHPSGIQICSDTGFGADTNGYSHTDPVIRGNRVHDNTGTAGDTSWNGSGINVAQTDGATITVNVVFGNGLLSNFSAAGAFGIRLEDSNEILVEENESYLNRAAVGVSDGGGILIGTGCTDCIVQRNYVHGNHGSGIKLYAGAEADIFAWDDNVVRFNVSEDDHTRAFELGGGIAVIADANMINVKVNNNTIYQRGGSPRNALMLRSTTGVLETDYEGYIANNIIVTTGTAALVQADGMNTAFMRLRGNNYFSSGTFIIEWNGNDYATYAAWFAAATTQERISAVDVGLHVDPLFTNPASSGVINANNSLLTAYKLQSASPMIGTGLDLQTEFSFSPGATDFHNSAITVPLSLGSSFAQQQGVLSISGTPVPTALQGSAYSGFTVAAAGGAGAKTYTLVGTWPTGLSVHVSTGVVSGTPTQTGVFAGLSIRATDTLSASIDLTPFTLTITSNVPSFTIAPVITPDSIFGGYGGSVWTCTPANWSAGTPTRQWYEDGVAVSGQTALTYTRPIADEGKVISCRETNAGIVAISNQEELWVPTDAITALPVAVMDIRLGRTGNPSVSAWASQIGGITASQATGAAQPQYSATSLGGRPGLTYDGGDSLQGLAISITPTVRSVIGAGQWPNSTVSYDIVRTSAVGGYTLRRNLNNGGFDVVSTGVAIRAQSAGALAPSITPRIFASRFTASGPFNFQGGGVDSNSGTSSGGFTGTGTEGIGDLMTGVLGSILIYDAYLTDDEFARAIGWVAWTTGQAGVLNAAAVYKNAAPRAVAATPTALAATVPEGTDNEAIIATIPTSLTNPVYTITAGGEGMSVVGGEVIISDKAAFFEQASPSATIRAAVGPQSQLFDLNCTIVPGYYDVGKFGHNLGMHWDFADQGTFITDAGDTFIEILKDKSSYVRHMQNPWFPDRRQRLANPSTLKSSMRGMRNITYPSSSLFGLVSMPGAIWHGIRYINMTSTSIILMAAKTPNNNDKTTFSGIPSMLGRNLMIVIIGTATTCTLRIDGVQVQQKTAGAGYFPPDEPFILGFTCRLISAGFILAPTLLGQHPFWEGGSFNGDITEFFQLFNVQAG